MKSVRMPVPGISLGCDYNPEQWSPDVWREDAALMRRAGVDLVAVNIFGWSNLEPSPGEYRFDDLDEVVELLHTHGIKINLGTGTSSPPPWLSSRYPETLPVTADGTTRFPGGRQAWCPSSPVFRDRALDLVGRVARRYGNHPALALWHVSNELGCHNALCYCETSADAFRTWLRARYRKIETLNEAWGTSFWSQRYSDWAEIQPPRLALSLRNPAQLVDFQRFSSDELLGYYRAEAAILRKHSTVPVTTNFMVTAHIRNLDYWSWAPEMDVVANDHYLDHRLGDPVAELSFAADLTRGLAGGRPWMLMEQAAGAVNWQPHNVTKAPGEMIRNSLTHVARGADSVCFFQWRASAQGAEKFHSALLPHAGTDTVAWREVLKLSETLDRIGEVAGTEVEADVALLFSWESWWSSEGEARPSQAVTYLDQVHSAHGALRGLGVTTDVVAPGADLSRYKLVVVPGLYMISDTDAQAIADYVSGGGRLVVTYFSGIVDERDRIRLGGYPGAFREVLGVLSEEFGPLLPGDTVALSNGGSASLWTERLRTTTASVIATYEDGAMSGIPAITRNQYGAGTAWYVATKTDMSEILREATQVVSDKSDKKEVVRRRGDGRGYLFVINHGTEAVDHPARGTDLITGEKVDGVLTVQGGGVAVVREENP
ncbi:beta-galactosidase [Actinoplanes philippinensis]|uniref:Beta-galactosidase n=2 Tax=Actinoplanes philippinensis TaxID=35752 RepID=A0A1I2FCK4_9ACTN|nr:beta-galactosidase [Actinoplanes philippinensis]GIE77668.1 beta-galactosidase [Actinoplanes philippinensis]SFF03204.1 beta-galactosidase [Actinoplanes philippinensis]